jgi:hypothetical protein
MSKFRKRPIEIEAVQWNGSNFAELANFCGERISDPGSGKLYVHTLEGVMLADKGDWIIRGIVNEVYPCKSQVFDQTYISVE